MLNSAVAVINSSTLRRRSHFARSATTNSYGPIPIDGDSSVPLMYSSQRSNSTSSTNSIVSIPGMGTVSNLIQVRSLEQSMENELNAITLSEVNEKGDIIPEKKPEQEQTVGSSNLDKFIKIAEYMYISDNKQLLEANHLHSSGITHVVSLGAECPFTVNVSRSPTDKDLFIHPLTLFHETDVDPSQPFKNLSSKFDNVNIFIENARKLSQKVVIYCNNRTLAYFVAAQYNIDYYDLEPAKAMHHLMKLIGDDWVELPEKCVKRLKEWKKLCEQRRAKSPTDRKLCLSINSISK
uniref:Rhodanese domain-containing protein n=1 Tax=Caenorhabditis tropicalis TaxID=1561998 RepID=A0A1I7TTF2_9PELO